MGSPRRSTSRPLVEAAYNRGERAQVPAAALAQVWNSVVFATSDEGDIAQVLHAAESLCPRLVHNDIRTHTEVVSARVRRDAVGM